MFENNALLKISPTNDRLSLKVDLYSVVNNNISDSNFLLQLCIDYIASGADTPSNSKPLRKTCCTLIESNKRACDKGIFVSSTNLTPS